MKLFHFYWKFSSKNTMPLIKQLLILPKTTVYSNFNITNSSGTFIFVVIKPILLQFLIVKNISARFFCFFHSVRIFFMKFRFFTFTISTLISAKSKLKYKKSFSNQRLKKKSKNELNLHRNGTLSTVTC